MYIKKSILLLLAFVLLYTNADAFEAIWKRYNEKNGLQGTTVIDIIQNADRITWLSTQGGLFRFDGYEFKEVKNNSEGLVPYVEKFVLSPNKQILCSSRQGLYWINTKTNELNKFHFHPINNEFLKDIEWNFDSTLLYIAYLNKIYAFPYDKKEGAFKSEPQIITINGYIEDLHVKEKTLYVNTDQFELLKIDAQKKVHRIAAFNPFVKCRYVPSLKKWAICSFDGFYLWDEQGLKTEHIDLPVPYKEFSTEEPIKIDPENRIWLITYNGIYRYNATLKNIDKRHLHQSNNPHSIINHINKIYFDKSMNIWAISGGTGISFTAYSTSSIGYMSNAAIGIKNTWAIYVDEESKHIFYGTEEQLVVCDSNHQVLKRIILKNKESRINIVGIREFDKEQLLILTYGNGVFLLNKKNYSQKKINSISNKGKYNSYIRIDKKTALLCFVGGMYKFNLIDHSFEPFCDSAYGNIWACIKKDKNTLMFINSNNVYTCTINGAFIKKYSLKHHKGIADNNSNALNLLKIGETIFVTTTNNGTYIYNKSKDEFKPLSFSNNPNITYNVAAIYKNNYVISNDKGLYVYDLRTHSCKQFNLDNILPFNDFSQFSMFSNAEKIYAGGYGGIISIDKKTFEKTIHEQLSVKLFQSYEAIEELRLSAEQNNINLDVFTNNQNIQHKLAYQYSLIGLEDKAHLSKTNKIVYNYLPSGEYLLRVEVFDTNGVLKSNWIEIPVFIEKKWYETYFFIGLVGILLILFTIYTVRYISFIKLKKKLKKLEEQQKINEERIRISKELHDNVGSQLTYLAGGLETSHLMLSKGKNEDVQNYLSKLQANATYSIQQLRDSIWALNSENIYIEELHKRAKNWMTNIIEFSAIRMQVEENILVNVQLDSLKALNLFRIIQESVHNIIKHAEANEIIYRIKSNQQFLEIEIQDNGKGFRIDEVNNNSNGLINMKYRGKEINTEVDIISEIGVGSTIHIKLHL